MSRLDSLNLTAAGSDSAARWTVDDYHQMIQAGILVDRRVELLNGVIVEMSPEGEPHAYYRRTAAKYLEQRLGEQVEVLQASPITIPGSSSEPEPDVAVVQPLGREYLQHHPYPENIFWLIEYSNSSLRRDRGIKAQIYAAAGIQEYWLMNLQAKRPSLIVMRDPVNGLYQARATYTDGLISPLAFPSIQLSLQQLLD